ncbi:hypothetical protein [Bordetella genomosp. 10]|uniref:hypothetical protein n=1 Tax=Bordetella genomosp. 10 TaxID=1416804 RepID=UPI0015C5AC11|nr:hypothetical protein [Bordetella genomosp. 10]
MAVAPFLWILGPAVVALLIGAGLFFGRGGPRDATGRKQFRLRPVRRLVGLLIVALAVVSGLLGGSLYQFHRLTSDQPVATVRLEQQGERQFMATAQLEGEAKPRQYQLRGDQWQIDARVVRWELPALLAGVPPLYRMDRLSGRYDDPVAEQAQPRTVYPLGGTAAPDLGTLKHRFPNWLPFVDVQFGSGAYMPMFDGARYRVFLDPRGALFVRPDDPATADGLKQRGW